VDDGPWELMKIAYRGPSHPNVRAAVMRIKEAAARDVGGDFGRVRVRDTMVHKHTKVEAA